MIFDISSPLKNIVKLFHCGLDLKPLEVSRIFSSLNLQRAVKHRLLFYTLCHDGRTLMIKWQIG